MHIDPHRLREMAQLHTVVEEKEWPHLRSCTECMENFTQFVQQRVMTEEAENRQGA